MFPTARASTIAAVTLAAIATWVAPASASAAPSASLGLQVAERVQASADPAAAYHSLSTQDRAAFDAANRLDHTELSVSAAGLNSNAGKTLLPAQAEALLATPVGQSALAAYSGCWAMQTKGAAKALAGNTLYTYGQSTEVCVRSSAVYYVKVYNVWDETSTPGWRIDKNPTTTTFNAGWEGRGRAQYYFVLGAGPWDVQHPTTCLQLRLNRDGSHYAASYSCNLS